MRQRVCQRLVNFWFARLVAFPEGQWQSSIKWNIQETRGLSKIEEVESLSSCQTQRDPQRWTGIGGKLEIFKIFRYAWWPVILIRSAHRPVHSSPLSCIFYCVFRREFIRDRSRILSPQLSVTLVLSLDNYIKKTLARTTFSGEKKVYLCQSTTTGTQGAAGLILAAEFVTCLADPALCIVCVQQHIRTISKLRIVKMSMLPRISIFSTSF